MLESKMCYIALEDQKTSTVEPRSKTSHSPQNINYKNTTRKKNEDRHRDRLDNESPSHREGIGKAPERVSKNKKVYSNQEEERFSTISLIR